MNQFVSTTPPKNNLCGGTDETSEQLYVPCVVNGKQYFQCGSDAGYTAADIACKNNPLAKCTFPVSQLGVCKSQPKPQQICDCDVENTDKCNELLCNKSYWRDDEGDCINVSKQPDKSYNVCFTNNKLTGTIKGTTLTLGKSLTMTLDKSSTKDRLVWVESDDRTKVNWYKINPNKVPSQKNTPVIKPRKMTANVTSCAKNDECSSKEVCYNNKCVTTCSLLNCPPFTECNPGPNQQTAKCDPIKCTNNDDCSASGTKCMDTPIGKVCLPSLPTGYGCNVNPKLCKSGEDCNTNTGKCESSKSSKLPLILGLSGGLLVVIMIAFMLSRKKQ